MISQRRTVTSSIGLARPICLIELRNISTKIPVYVAIVIITEPAGIEKVYLTGISIIFVNPNSASLERPMPAARPPPSAIAHVMIVS